MISQLAIALLAASLAAGQSVPTDPELAKEAQSILTLDDAGFAAQFQCPESLPSPDDEIRKVGLFLYWAKNKHPEWSTNQSLAFRHQLFVQHRCVGLGGDPSRSPPPELGPDVNTVIAAYDATDETHKHNFLQLVKGQEQALMFADAYVAAHMQKGFYCPPSEATLSGSQLVEMMRDAARTDARIGKMPQAMGLLITLVKAYPCSATK